MAEFGKATCFIFLDLLGMQPESVRENKVEERAKRGIL
jgi:hypothetical protein